MMAGKLGAPFGRLRRRHQRLFPERNLRRRQAAGRDDAAQVPITQSMPSSSQHRAPANGAAMGAGADTAMARSDPAASSDAALVAVMTPTSAWPSSTCATA